VLRLLASGILGLLLAQAAAPALLLTPPGDAGLDLGYRQLYNLEFDSAHSTFSAWRSAHPDDPLGPASDAAVFLFQELHRLGVLQARFFSQNADFMAGPAGVTNPGFEPDLIAANALAAKALAAQPNNVNALFVEALCHGLRSDDLGIVHKRYISSLDQMKQARRLATRVLALDPDYGDAYLAVGVENYVLSLKPAPVRWLLRLDGASTDRAAGVHDLQRAAATGHYLQPFARILLTIAALRDRDLPTARRLTAGLAEEFVANPLYPAELARLGEATATLDPAHTRIQFRLGAFLHSVHGSFQLSQGRIVWDPDTGHASGALLISSASAESGNPDRDRTMHDQVLESARFPNITFRPASLTGKIARSGNSQVLVHGTLNLVGADHALDLPLEVTVTGNNFEAVGKVSIPYVAWGLKDPSNLVLHVDKSVELNIAASGTVTWPE